MCRLLEYLVLLNGRVHGSEGGERDSLVERIQRFLDSFQLARFMFPISPAAHGGVVWQRPEEPFVKVNFDAAVYDSGDYQIAAVARDSEGRCLRWRVQKFHGSPSPVVAEA